MKRTLMRWGPALVAVAALVGCGGGSDPVAVASPPATVAATITAASALPANDTSGTDPASNPFTPFVVLQNAGLPAVTIDNSSKVNFAVFSDSKIKTGLTLNDVRFAIAKLVPGTNGDPDKWVNYISTTKTGVAGKGPLGTPNCNLPCRQQPIQNFRLKRMRRSGMPVSLFTTRMVTTPTRSRPTSRIRQRRMAWSSSQPKPIVSPFS